MSPEEGQFCGTGKGSGGERSSAFINSFQGQKQLWVQVPMQPQSPSQMGLRPQDGVETMGSPLSLGTSESRMGKRAPRDKGHGSSLGARPRSQLVVSF